jgi:two-component system LytT family sensor kinase
MTPPATIPADISRPAPVPASLVQESPLVHKQANVEHPEKKAARSSRERKVWLLVLAVCVSIGLSDSAFTYWGFQFQGDRISIPRALGLGLGMWCSWALLWLIAWPLARRFPLGPKAWRGRLVLHLVASVFCVFLKMLLDYPVMLYFYPSKEDTNTFVGYLQMTLTYYTLRYILFYWAMIGVSHAVDYFGKYRDGQLRAAQLESGLTRARLQLLKTQLQPHFLFNTLNAISALVHVDVEAADRTLARLGDLLRLALEDFAVQEAPLARELEIARSYLEIEQARLGPRLRIEWDIASDCCDALVPTFLLQPLIENAIHHGIAPRIGPGCVLIRVRRLGDELHLEVRDDGLGLSSAGKSGTGVGLANTRARLLHLYGTAQRLEVSNLPQGGCLARIVLPFRELAGELSVSK